MANDYNHCAFTGRLGKDPIVRYSTEGKAVATFSIACNESYKKKNGEKVEKCEWISIVAFGKLAEIIGEYLSKGSLVLIAGKMQTRKWKDKSDNDRYTTEIVANQMQMLGSKGDKPESSTPEETKPEQEPDCPF